MQDEPSCCDFCGRYIGDTIETFYFDDDPGFAWYVCGTCPINRDTTTMRSI